jgi:processive 1,2-diacylglycerol beta-glucosyltransferase
MSMRRSRFSTLRIPRLTQRWRARLRAQRRLWRQSRSRLAVDRVLFPAVGGGVVAVRDLTPAAAGPRILVLHATAGSGHKRAAQALAHAIQGLDPSAVVREVDTLLFASRFYRRTYAASYNAMAARAPRLWGALYHSWAAAPVNRSTAPLRLALDRMNLRHLVRVIERERADAILCTHFLPVEALSPLRRSLAIPLFCVITDFGVHPFWAFPHVDRYFVASEATAEELAGHGVPRGRIEVSGIPTEPCFAQVLDRDECRRALGLDPGRPVVLVMGGGGGVGPLAELAELLVALEARPQVVVVCGTNEKLRARLLRMPAARARALVVLGFSDEVDRLLTAADVVVSKAGGLTCSEALIKGTPLVVFRPTPGQEVRNAECLQREGAAFHADAIGAAAARVGALLADPATRAAVRAAAARLAQPHAAERIAAQVLEVARAHARGAARAAKSA